MTQNKALQLIKDLNAKGLTNEARRIYDMYINNGHVSYIKG